MLNRGVEGSGNWWHGRADWCGGHMGEVGMEKDGRVQVLKGTTVDRVLCIGGRGLQRMGETKGRSGGAC